MKILLILFSLSIFIVGCAGYVERRDLSDPKVAEAYNNMKVIHGYPDSNYIDLGIVEASSESTGFTYGHDMNAMIKELKRNAAKLGATAIFIDPNFNMSAEHDRMAATAAREKSH
jgi:hypothetical protein